jgi:hypothetical protein
MWPVEARRGEPPGCRARCGEASRRAAAAGVGKGAAPDVERRRPGPRCGRWRHDEGTHRAAATGVGRQAAGLPRPACRGEQRSTWRGGGLGPDAASGDAARGATGLPRLAWGGESPGCRSRRGERSHARRGEATVNPFLCCIGLRVRREGCRWVRKTNTVKRRCETVVTFLSRST